MALVLLAGVSFPNSCFVRPAFFVVGWGMDGRLAGCIASVWYIDKMKTSSVWYVASYHVVDPLAGACLGCGFSAAGGSIVSKLLSLLGRPFLYGGSMEGCLGVFGTRQNVNIQSA